MPSADRLDFVARQLRGRSPRSVRRPGCRRPPVRGNGRRDRSWPRRGWHRSACRFASVRQGRTTRNSVPLPAPALDASMRPWCSSTRRCASVSPTPSPPWPRSSERSPCLNSSKTLGSSSASMPMPLSRTLITAWPSSHRDGELNRAALLGVLGGVVEQVRRRPATGARRRRAAIPASRHCLRQPWRLRVDVAGEPSRRMRDDVAAGRAARSAARSCPG